MHKITFSGVLYILVSYVYVMDRYVRNSLDWRSVLLVGLLGVVYLVTATFVYIFVKTSRRAVSLFVSIIVLLLVMFYLTIFYRISSVI